MRVLIVEDEPRIVDFLTSGLEAEGFSVESALEGREGLTRALESPYDLLILDLRLPDLDGFDVLGELARQRPNLRILVLSARRELADRLRAFEFGASDYVMKPFSFEELLARVRVHAARAPGDRTARILRAGRLTLDLPRRQASLDGVECNLTDHLTDLEFRVLWYLAEHAGEIVSRERLLSEIWGYQLNPVSNVVEVCIRRLRKKLGPEVPIETIRNAGYRVLAA